MDFLPDATGPGAPDIFLHEMGRRTEDIHMKPMIRCGTMTGLLALAVLLGCSRKKPNAPSEDPYAGGIPKFVRTSYIEFGRIARISRFRSAVGGDYSDDFERCRSMKHCFEPKPVFDWSTIPIFTPVDGTVIRIVEEPAGSQVWIKSREYPDIEFGIFHVHLQNPLAAGQTVNEGQRLGTHIGGQALSEIAVGVRSAGGWRLVSYFDALTDTAMQAFRSCGSFTPYDFIISREARDADPLGCEGDSLVGGGRLDDWINLGCRYDIDAWGIPRFVRVNYIELDRIGRISRFRSSIGHDYSDFFEDCRSMKHYFMPEEAGDWSTVRVFSPVDGTVSRFFKEFAGTQVWIQSSEYPDFEFRIFHVKLLDSLSVGQILKAGRQLGTHIGSQTMSDIAVAVSTPVEWKLVSYFDVMTDTLFQAYQARGARERGDFIITREARDADPLTCTGETFGPYAGPTGDWFVLN